MICAAVLMINLTTLPWIKIDYQNRAVAEKRCAQLYKDAPCLVKFIKVREQMYRAICGEKK